MKKMKICIQSELTFREGCEEYLRNCEARNLRTGTIKHYKESIKQLYKYIGEDTPITRWGVIL